MVLFCRPKTTACCVVPSKVSAHFWAGNSPRGQDRCRGVKSRTAGPGAPLMTNEPPHFSPVKMQNKKFMKKQCKKIYQKFSLSFLMKYREESILKRSCEERFFKTLFQDISNLHFQFFGVMTLVTLACPLFSPTDSWSAHLVPVRIQPTNVLTLWRFIHTDQHQHLDSTFLLKRWSEKVRFMVAGRDSGCPRCYSPRQPSAGRLSCWDRTFKGRIVGRTKCASRTVTRNNWWVD